MKHGQVLRSRGVVRGITFVFCLAMLATGCGHSGDGHGGGTPGKPATDVATIMYGSAVKPDPNVKLQPDVVIVEGGPKAIRSVSGDGAVWTIDGHAKGAGDLQPGKIMFATSKAVGRVAEVKKAGDDLAVTLSPVGLTDVIKDGEFSVDTGLDLGKAPIQAIPELPGQLVESKGAGSPSTEPTAEPTEPEPTEPETTEPEPTDEETTEQPTGEESDPADLFSPDDEGGGPAASGPPAHRVRPQVPVRAGEPAQVVEMKAPVVRLPASGWPKPIVGATEKVGRGNWEFEPFANQKELGLNAAYKAGKDFKGTMQIAVGLNKPRIKSTVSVAGGKLNPGWSFTVAGLGPLRVQFGAGNATKNGTLKFRGEIPVELPVEMPMGGIPFIAVIKFKIIFETALVGKNSTISGSGVWNIGGAIGRAGGQTLAPKISVVKSLMDSLNGISLGGAGIVYGFELRSLIGIGLPMAYAGPYWKLTVVWGNTLGGALGGALSDCKSGVFNVNFAVGIGSMISTEAIDWFSKFLGKKPVKWDQAIEFKAEVVKSEDWLPRIAKCKP
ncbi:hypothetical protein [Kribbella sp. NPDC006257]|uniref:hypothetical protein n=1 Tax=Kribbella sp. NPDC006257 TaxID=3156738 RepID=UPI0033BD2F93